MKNKPVKFFRSQLDLRVVPSLLKKIFSRNKYRVVPILLFITKLCFIFFFHIFQVVQSADLEDSFDTNMDPTGRFTSQQPIKIIEAYFAAKSVLLTQRQCTKYFGGNNVPDRRTIQRLVAKFREIGSVSDAPQKPQWSSSFKSFKSFKSNKPG